MSDSTTPQDDKAMSRASAGFVDHRRQLRVRDWRGGTSLTDLEREAIECGIQAIGLAPRDDRTLAFADTLRGLLERLGSTEIE